MPAPKGHPPYNKNGEGGRKSPYTDEIIEKYADKFQEWLKEPNHIWFKDFALDNDFHPDRLYEWANRNKRFASVYNLAKERQQSRLINGGLSNILNSGLVKFTLNVHHGWIEKKETVHTNNPDNPVPEWMMKSEGTSKDLVSDEAEG